MINIKINNDVKKDNLIDPCDMINSFYGTVFQQYQNGEPCDDYYVSCGTGEKSVIHIWTDEDDIMRLSTDNAKSLSELYNTVKVKKIDCTIDITIRKSDE